MKMVQIRQDRLTNMHSLIPLLMPKQIGCIYVFPTPKTEGCPHERYNQEQRFVHSFLSKVPFKCLYVIPNNTYLHPLYHVLYTDAPNRFIIYSPTGKINKDDFSAMVRQRIKKFLRNHTSFRFLGDADIAKIVESSMEIMRRQFGLPEKEFKVEEKLSYEMRNGIFVRLDDFSSKGKQKHTNLLTVNDGIQLPNPNIIKLN